jgi:hypothetical protein
MKRLALMVTEIWSGNEIYVKSMLYIHGQMKFQDGRLPGVQSEKKPDLRMFTLNLPYKFGDH